MIEITFQIKPDLVQLSYKVFRTEKWRVCVFWGVPFFEDLKKLKKKDI